jgi:catechol 2,3-dioxygenase-like lactoylglutathione lyase family enzyme
VSPIHHVELTVSSLTASGGFYGPLLRALGWKELRLGMYLKDGCEIYLKEARMDASGPSYGPRHVCLRAGSREEVDRVGALLRAGKAQVIRGPLAIPEYGATYYTVDFRDPDGFVLEVAHD